MARIVEHDERVWHNFHFTERNVPVAARFELHRKAQASIAEMRACAEAVQGLIARAITERRRLRAHGATWAFSAAASIPGGWPLATGYANQIFPLPASHVAPGFTGDKDGLVLCQTGVSVAELNMWLEPRGRSMPTTGASNGQTIAGAMSCGTHGSAIDHPGIEGTVRAIQLIPAPDRNLWIEPASRPVTDGRLAADLGAIVVRDDALFAAALVSLGALGVIHAVLVESVPRFLMEMHRQRLPLTPALRSAISGGDLLAAGLPGAVPAGGGAARRPYFFQAVLADHVDKGHAHITAGYRRDWQAGHTLDYSIKPKRGPGYNLAVVVANIMAAAPGTIPVITKAVLSGELKPLDGKVLTSWGQTFNFTTPRAGQAGAAVAVPADRVNDVLAILNGAYKAIGKAPVVFAVRYATASPALIGFTRFARTAIVDIDGIDMPRTRAVMARAVADLRTAGIPHAEHWGKLNQMTAASVRDAYGNNLEQWLKIRRDLLDRDGEYIFGSPWLDRIGLTDANF